MAVETQDMLERALRCSHPKAIVAGAVTVDTTTGAVIGVLLDFGTTCGSWGVATAADGKLVSWSDGRDGLQYWSLDGPASCGRYLNRWLSPEELAPKGRPDGNAVGARLRARGWKPTYYPIQTIQYSHPNTSRLVEVFLDGAVRLVTAKSQARAWKYTKDFRGHTLSEM